MAPPSYGEGESFFTEVTPRFEAVDAGRAADGATPTVPFLDACDALIRIFDALGKAFALVKSDMSGNVGKLRKRHAEDPARFATLEAIAGADIAAGTTASTSSATCALLWLKRALQYIVVLLRGVVAGDPPRLSDCAARAYEQTLARVHGWIVRGTFSVALKMAPSKESFIACLGADEGTVMAHMAAFLAVFEPQIAHIVKFYDDNKLENDAKV
jgi:hypothetical protein